MIDFDRVEGFDWDNGNARKSMIKHGVSQAEAEQVFFKEPLIVSPDVAHSGVEARFQALGSTEVGRPLHVAFTLRNEGRLIRVISARSMNRKERLRYEQET